MASTLIVFINQLFLLRLWSLLFVHTVFLAALGSAISEAFHTSCTTFSPLNSRSYKIINKNSVVKCTMSGAGKVATAAVHHLMMKKQEVGKVRPESSVLLICDIQERFRPLIWKMETVIQTCRYMTSVAKTMNIPMVATQQYTKVFGPTIRDCFSNPDVDLASLPIFEKKKFSMLTDEVSMKLNELGGLLEDENPSTRTSYIVCGIETHVCVQQTCLDLLERGADVHVIVDGVSSQQPMDREVAIQRLIQSGAFVTTAQSMVYMLMQSADHPNFKTVSQLTVEHMKLPNEFNMMMTVPPPSSVSSTK